MENKTKKKIQTTKIIAAVLMIFILVNSLMIEFYAMYAMFVLNNLEALDVLITTAIGSCLTLVLEFAIYSAKSFLETKAEKQLEFEREKFQYESNVDTTDGDIDDNNTDSIDDSLKDIDGDTDGSSDTDNNESEEIDNDNN
uniref:hypothetical protein n=1 Tax=Coprococcus catus TaxID=116085 RepID=UPI0022E2C327|nr:hypothetical protein [Coprococcus catus]